MIKKPIKKKYGEASFKTNNFFSVLMLETDVPNLINTSFKYQKKNTWQINPYKKAGKIIELENHNNRSLIFI